MARYVFTPTAVAPGARVRFDTASGSATPATINPLDSAADIPGAALVADGAGNLPAVVSTSATLYQKTLDYRGVSVTATATLTGVAAPTGTGNDPRSELDGTYGPFGTAHSALDLYHASGVVSNVPASGLYPVRLKTFRKAMSKVRAGTGPARILCVGDSTTMGVGAAGGYANSYPGKLQTLLNGYLAPTTYTFGTPQQASYNDGRWVASGDAHWAFVPTGTLAGFGAKAHYRHDNNAAATTLTYTPSSAYDTVVVHYAVNTTNPTAIPVTIAGNAQTAINASGTAAWGKTTYTVTQTSGTIVFGTPTGSTGGNAFVLGVETYIANAPEIQIANVGVGSSTTVGWTDTTLVSGVFNGANGIKAYAPDLTLIMLGINDARASTASATVTTNLTTLVTAAKVSGDAILMSFTPANTDQPGQSLEAGYATAYAALAASLGVPYVDVFTRYGGAYATTNAAGFAADGIGHFNATGYADLAQAVFDTLRHVAG